MPSISGRTALVTGGGRGIGRAVALGLADRGARVAVLSRSRSEVEETVALIERIPGAGTRAMATVAEVGDRVQVVSAVEDIRQRWGPIQILINNAGVVSPLGTSTQVSFEHWTEAMAINVTAPARLSFMLLPAMQELGWGRIVNVSSSVAGNPSGMLRANAYTTSKAALEAHSINLGAELTGTGVTVNAYRPGSVDTAMQAWIRSQDPVALGDELHRRFVDNHRQGRLITPERSAEILLRFLESAGNGEIWDAAEDQVP